jgi:hypothetical protein
MNRVTNVSDWMVRAKTAKSMKSHGWTIDEIASSLGLSTKTIYKDLRQLSGLMPYEQQHISSLMDGCSPYDCPCGGRFRVYDTRKSKSDFILRRRECDNCGQRIRTEERTTNMIGD